MREPCNGRPRAGPSVTAGAERPHSLFAIPAQPPMRPADGTHQSGNFCKSPAPLPRAVQPIPQLLDAADIVDETTACIVWVMARAGRRVGEAFALRRADVDLRNGVLHVRRSLNRKGEVAAPKGRRRSDQGRTIPLPSDLAGRLGRHLAANTVASMAGWIVTSPMGAPIRYGNWRRRVWKPIVRLADVEANPHDLRHTAVTRLIKVDRWAPSEVQRFAGHRDPRVTLGIYTHISTADLPPPTSIPSQKPPVTGGSSVGER